MTKVTAEMLERVDAVIAHAEQCAEPESETAADLRVLVELCRRVIEPGEGELIRYERAAWTVESEPIQTMGLRLARAVLAAIADPTAS